MELDGFVKQEARIELAEEPKVGESTKGYIYGHPNYPHIIEGEFCYTSEVVAVDEGAGTFETMNTLYSIILTRS